jgi:hypothetical protein
MSSDEANRRKDQFTAIPTLGGGPGADEIDAVAELPL